jgi:hypothetical protein
VAPAPVRIWERQDQESEASWAGFQAYRDGQRPRQLEDVARKFRVPLHKIIDLCNDNSWRQRVLEFDRWEDANLLEDRLAVLQETQRDVTIRHLRLIRMASEVAAEDMSKLLATAKESEQPVVNRVADLIKLMDAAVKLDRLERGQATEILQAGAPVLDLSQFTPEELLVFEKLATKAGIPLGAETTQVPALPAK